GEFGGSVVYEGIPRDEGGGMRDELSRSPFISHPSSLRIVGARQHNLKNIDVSIPLGQLVAVTGVSGSGKSTLIRDCLYNRYQREYRGVSGLDVGKIKALEGVDQVYDIQLVDQSPIGRSSRSNPATYVKAWDEIRKLLSETTTARLNGVTAGMFSFNT